MKQILKLLFLTNLAMYSTICFSYTGLVDAQTTRLSSNAGAGVATILLNESALLNPASIVFLKENAFYFQQSTEKIEEKASSRTTKFQEIEENLYILSDTTSGMNGAFAYQYRKEENGSRVRYSTSLSKPYGRSTGLGVIVNYSNENSTLINDSYFHFVLGLMTVTNEDLIFGLTIVDPSQEVAEYFKYTAGVQYTLNSLVNIVFDIGSGDVENYGDEAFIRWSVQLQAFMNTFLRYGTFHDQMLNRKGTALGLSWNGPRFSFDYSHKLSSIIYDSDDNVLKDEELLETSFGITVKF